MDKIAVFGGTFNPVHKGHIRLCMECQQQFAFDQILLLPSNLPPHKAAVELASNEDRLQMCRLAIAGNPLFEVSSLEMQRQGLSYTIDTIELLKQQYAGAQLYLIIGSDMLFMFDQWKRYRDILNLTTVVVGARHPGEYDRMKNYKERLGSCGETIRIIHSDVVDISSTQLRDALKSKKEAGRYLENSVYRYIVERRLYMK